MSLRLSPAVKRALSRAEPIVALESTVITHGLPRPQNLELARSLEAVVRGAGALPATIALLDGELVVGASEGELERLAQDECEKASLWNLAALVAGRGTAGTTVAATLYAAQAAGIEVFATGGIGGVHPQLFDESADLVALSRFRVLTVCAGPKSILQAHATLERLETLGVAVVGYRSRHLAGFHVAQTDLPLPTRLDTPQELAASFRAHSGLGLPGGMLVSNPVSQGLASNELEEYRLAAEEEAQRRGVTGKELTPFLLAQLARLSENRTVDVNVRLLHENALLAAQVAAALHQPQYIQSHTTRSPYD